MERALRSNRADENGCLPCDSKKLRAEIGLGDVHQAASPQLEVLESSTVGGLGEIVIDTGNQVSEVRRRKCCARYRLEIADAERLCGTTEPGLPESSRG